MFQWIDTYVQLAGEDAAEYGRLLALKKNKEVRRMEQTWMNRYEEQGFKKGKVVGQAQAMKKVDGRLGKAEAQGFKKGKAEAVDRMRRMVLKQIEQRFGPVTEPVQAITSIEALARLFAKVPSLRSPEDLLPRRNGRAKSTD